MKKDVKIGAKRFCLTIGEGRQSGRRMHFKTKGASAKDGSDRKPRVMATSRYRAGPQGPCHRGGEGVREKVLSAENWSYPLQDTLADCAVQT